MARSEFGRRLSLHEGIIGAMGLVLDDDEEEKEEVGQGEPVDHAKNKEECSLETAVQVCLILKSFLKCLALMK